MLTSTSSGILFFLTVTTSSSARLLLNGMSAPEPTDVSIFGEPRLCDPSFSRTTVTNDVSSGSNLLPEILKVTKEFAGKQPSTSSWANPLYVFHALVLAAFKAGVVVKVELLVWVKMGCWPGAFCLPLRIVRGVHFVLTWPVELGLASVVFM